MKDLIRKTRVKLIRIFAIRKSDFPLPYTSIILAPHPDDEIIGCGGLIAKMVKYGCVPEVVIMSGGGGSHRGCCGIDEDALIAERRKLTLKAADIVGLPHKNIHFLDFKDGSISETDVENMNRLKAIMDALKPQRILVPCSGEGWRDHLVVQRIGLKLAAATTEVWEYCVWMWYYNIWHLDWRNAAIVKMDKDGHQRKLAAMDAYIMPLAPCGKPWSGVLPQVFVDANRWNKELYFRLR